MGELPETGSFSSLKKTKKMSGYIQWLEDTNEDEYDDKKVDVSPTTLQSFLFDTNCCSNKSPSEHSVSLLSMGTRRKRKLKGASKAKKRKPKNVPFAQALNQLEQELEEKQRLEQQRLEQKLIEERLEYFPPDSHEFILQSGVVVIIAQFLTTRHLCTLCSVSKLFRYGFSSNLIWKKRYVERWHSEISFYSKKPRSYRSLFLRDSRLHAEWFAKQEGEILDMTLIPYVSRVQQQPFQTVSENEKKQLKPFAKYFKECWRCRSHRLVIWHLSIDFLKDIQFQCQNCHFFNIFTDTLFMDLF